MVPQIPLYGIGHVFQNILLVFAKEWRLRAIHSGCKYHVLMYVLVLQLYYIHHALHGIHVIWARGSVAHTKVARKQDGGSKSIFTYR